MLPCGVKSGLLPLLPDVAVAAWHRAGEAPSSSLECCGSVIAILLSQALVTPVALRPEILDGNQLVIIVGIVCATILLLPVLILIVKKAYGNKRYGAAPISWTARLRCL